VESISDQSQRVHPISNYELDQEEDSCAAYHRDDASLLGEDHGVWTGEGIENVRAAIQSSACYPSYTVVVFMPDVTLLSKGEEVEGNRKWQALGIGR
jgi:hypothetical protein